MIYAILPPDWLRDADPNVRSQQLECSFETALQWNEAGFNVYYYPNYPTIIHPGFVKAEDVDVFEWVFIDLDMKHGAYASKDEFLDVLGSFALPPSKIVDSGGGIHAYWRVTDLNATGFLKLSRRLMRHFKTDDAVQQLKQLMRVPGTRNMKYPDEVVSCELLYETDLVYTSEQLDKALPNLLHEDATYCKTHYDRAHNKEEKTAINDKLPVKFGQLLKDSQEVKDIWTGITDDRSKSDYRLGHLMLAAGFNRAEALSVLVNSAKALDRAPVHRVAYAEGIVDKIFTFEVKKDKEAASLSKSVEEILEAKDDDALKGQRFRGNTLFDGTEHGFRLSQVVGLCAGVGVGKTAIALNIFKGYVELNPNFIHIFISLEQPGREIALRWKKMCGSNTEWHHKVHILDNYNEDGSYRNLSLTEIQEYIIQFQKERNIKVGCVCLDHIGILRQENKKGEYQGLRDVCSQLKAFAISTNTLFFVQSQTNREKAGVGDLELFKDAAFGTQSFESFLDFMIVAWQPLKRCYDMEGCPKITAYKFAKIRFKSKNDKLIEDQVYRLSFDQDIETFKEMTEAEEKSFSMYNSSAINKRKRDRKTDVIEYRSTKTLSRDDHDKTG